MQKTHTCSRCKCCGSIFLLRKTCRHIKSNKNLVILGYGSVTRHYLAEVGIPPEQFEKKDDRYERKQEVMVRAYALSKIGLSGFEVPFYGKNAFMRYSEFCVLYEKATTGQKGSSARNCGASFLFFDFLLSTRGSTRKWSRAPAGVSPLQKC